MATSKGKCYKYRKELGKVAISYEDMESYKVKDVMCKGMSFNYEYDYGSTTTQKITVVENNSGPEVKKKVSLLARNVMEKYECRECGEIADYFVTDGYEEYIPLCENCLEDSGYDDWNIVRITNSPRMGICGYDGKNKEEQK
jgi:hypothetical protein